MDAIRVAHGHDMPSINTMRNCPRCRPQVCGGGHRYFIVLDKWLVSLVFLTLAKTCEASASEQVVIHGDALKPDFNTAAPRTPISSSLSTFSLPPGYEAAELSEDRPFPTQDFRPRGRSVLDKGAPDSVFQDAPMIRSTTLWQRLSDYRAHGRVRVLTLWETGSSTISLLAGKNGEPSLQWTSRSMNRGGATRGLLDQFVSASFAGASRSLHLTPRAPGADSSSKPSKLVQAAAAGK